jgi:hypothetical protein
VWNQKHSFLQIVDFKHLKDYQFLLSFAGHPKEELNCRNLGKLFPNSRALGPTGNDKAQPSGYALAFIDGLVL